MLGITKLSVLQRYQLQGGWFKEDERLSNIFVSFSLAAKFQKDRNEAAVDKIAKGVRQIPNVLYLVIYYQVPNPYG